MTGGEDPRGSGERQTVGICLIKTEEGGAAVAYLTDECPELRIHDRGTFYLVEGEGQIQISLAGVSEHLGRDLSIHTFLVSMASYYGRVHIDEQAFTVSSEMHQLEPRRLG